MTSKIGMSGVIVSIIMIALAIVITGIVWGVVNNLIKEQISATESCFGNFGKVSLGKQYTCYDTTPSPDQVQFSINIGDIKVEGVLISISGKGGTESFTITNEEQTISDLANYSSGIFGTDLIKLPKKNGGTTYILEWNYVDPANNIQIAPIINGNQCEVSDSLSNIEDCNLLA